MIRSEPEAPERLLPIRKPADADERLEPWWISPLFLLLAALLLPWVGFLFLTLPSRTVAAHWEIAWGGFDVGLALLLGGTAIALWRRSPIAEMLAAMTAAFLVCDAWFDVLTSSGTTSIVLALAEAAFIELPLAFVCIRIALRMSSVWGEVRLFLRRAGFRIEDRHLVGPSEPAEDVTAS
jgi:hypothetical protein